MCNRNLACDNWIENINKSILNLKTSWYFIVSLLETRNWSVRFDLLVCECQLIVIFSSSSRKFDFDDGDICSFEKQILAFSKKEFCSLTTWKVSIFSEIGCFNAARNNWLTCLISIDFLQISLCAVCKNWIKKSHFSKK